MKRFKNISNRHLQFFYAKIELAPGRERDVDDETFKGDPGFRACLESGYLEEVKNATPGKSAVSGKKGSSKSDLFDPDAAKKPEDLAPDKKDS